VPKAALQRLDDAKRVRIFMIAAEEFARRGFHGANVDDVARRAGIAKGAVYLYFDSKLDLYKETLRAGAAVLEEILDQALTDSDCLGSRLRFVYSRAQTAMEAAPQMWRMYCDLVNSSDPDLLPMAAELEAASARFYRRLIKDGRARGEVRDDLPVALLAYLLDNAFVQFFAAWVSGYQAERLKMFWLKGDGTPVKLARYVDDVLRFVMAGLAPPGGTNGHARRSDHE